MLLLATSSLPTASIGSPVYVLNRVVDRCNVASGNSFYLTPRHKVDGFPIIYFHTYFHLIPFISTSTEMGFVQWLFTKYRGRSSSGMGLLPTHCVLLSSYPWGCLALHTLAKCPFFLHLLQSTDSFFVVTIIWQMIILATVIASLSGRWWAWFGGP